MNDQGHKNLIADLTKLHEEASQYQFHDFQNTKYATPKVALVRRLEDMVQKTKEGRYDN